MISEDERLQLLEPPAYSRWIESHVNRCGHGWGPTIQANPSTEACNPGERFVSEETFASEERLAEKRLESPCCLAFLHAMTEIRS